MGLSQANRDRRAGRQAGRQAGTHKHTHAHTHTHMHTHIHKHTHTYKHTYTSTHTSTQMTYAPVTVPTLKFVVRGPAMEPKPRSKTEGFEEKEEEWRDCCCAFTPDVDTVWLTSAASRAAVIGVVLALTLCIARASVLSLFCVDWLENEWQHPASHKQTGQGKARRKDTATSRNQKKPKCRGNTHNHIPRCVLLVFVTILVLPLDTRN